MQIEIDYRKPLKLLMYPHPILTMKCVTVVDFSEDLKYFCTQMFLFIKSGALNWGRPVGLAAPQVGLPIRVFVAEDGLYINPEIIWKTKAPFVNETEGCYSLGPNKLFEAERSQSIRLKYQDHQGNWNEQRFNGFHARVIQHELDHLN